MNITELSESEILALQYSLLEELKFKRTQTDNEEDNPYKGYPIGRSKVENSPYRKNIDDMLNKGFSSRKISRYLQDTYDENISHVAINTYKQNHFSKTEKWKDTTQKTVERDSKEYNRFKESVLRRDKVCQCCSSSEELEVHHTLSFKQYNSLGADPNNGIVLCKECHSKYHKENGYKRSVNPVTLAQFLRDYGMNPQTSLDDSKEISEDVILKNIEEYQKDYGECSIKRLLNDFKEFGFDIKDISDEINHLLQVGKIYMPSKGIVKVVV